MVPFIIYLYILLEIMMAGLGTQARNMILSQYASGDVAKFYTLIYLLKIMLKRYYEVILICIFEFNKHDRIFDF